MKIHKLILAALTLGVFVLDVKNENKLQARQLQKKSSANPKIQDCGGKFRKKTNKFKVDFYLQKLVG